MSASEKQLQAAQAEADDAFEWYKRKDKEIRLKYRNEKGLDPGAKEHRAALDEYMNKIRAIRKKYGIPEPKND